MRLLRLAAAAATALTLAATPAIAGFDSVVYGSPFAPVQRAIGYVFDAPDPRAPVYIVDQGPVFAGPGVYAHHEIDVPLAYRTRCGCYVVVRPDAYVTGFPYVRHVPDVRVLPRRPGIAPYAASVYWPEGYWPSR